jgi:hypothetical protein
LVDGFVWRSELQRLELLGEVAVAGDEPVTDVPSQLLDRRVVEGFDGRFLDRPDHALGLSVGLNRPGFPGGIFN